MTIPMNLLLITGVFALCFIFSRSKQQRFQAATLYACLMSGFFIFSMGLLILYINCYTTYEAIRLASFKRYLNIYLPAMHIVGFALLAMQSKRLESQYHKRGYLIFLFVSMLFLITVAFFLKPRTMMPLRQEMELLSKKVHRQLGNRTTRIFFVHQNSNGNSRNLFDFATRFWGYSAMNIPYSFGKPYDVKDVWTRDVDVASLRRQLADYDYVLLVHTDQQFWLKYRVLFSGMQQHSDPQLCRISHDKGGTRIEPCQHLQ